MMSCRLSVVSLLRAVGSPGRFRAEESSDQPHTVFIITMMLLTSMTMVLIMRKFELFLCTKSCAKSFTPIMTLSLHRDPLSLEYWIIGCVLPGSKGRTTGVLRLDAGLN